MLVAKDNMVKIRNEPPAVRILFVFRLAQEDKDKKLMVSQSGGTGTSLS